VLSFTVETNGVLLDGTKLGGAIEAVDELVPGGVAYYVINCAHPGHFAGALREEDHLCKTRIGGVRANASTRRHAELEASEELDAGDAEDLARWYAELRGLLPGLRVFGGCCGTDQRHLAAICRQALSRRKDGN
jgi:homocysteine S-methyltransferase